MTEPAKEIIPVNLEDEMRRSYLDYAMSVIVGRALPDVRDGLKPVHRRVLHAMNELGAHSNKPYYKSARIVGDVIGKYHPHGDIAVYDTLVRMAQPFSLRYMLVDGQGNFGSIDGDNAAAMRYTEARMSKLSHELMADIDKDTVDFQPNYDEKELEPTVLPTRVPNLLINGSAGIAVGMATNIPPHNLSEVINATVALLDEPEIDIDGLMQHIPGPDFPTAGIINGVGGIHLAYRTGRGRVRMRARADVEVADNGRDRAVPALVRRQAGADDLVPKHRRISDRIRRRFLSARTDRGCRDRAACGGARDEGRFLPRDRGRGRPARNRFDRITPGQHNMDALVLLGGFVVFCFMGVPVAYALGLSAICAALWMDIPLEAIALKTSDGP